MFPCEHLRMNAPQPPQTPEGRLIEAAAKATGQSARSLAANAGMSDTRWRQIVRGHQPGPGGEPIPVKPPALTLARMAFVVNLVPEQLSEVGRDDAADLLVRLMEDAARPAGIGIGVSLGSPTATQTPDEIEMIYRSTTMTDREKLVAIRRVLELRARIEAEEATSSDAPVSGGAVETRPQISNNG